MHSNSGDREQRPDCIVFSNASVKRGERLIWQHGDFSIPAGSVTAIVGTNGTGKTTLLNMLVGLDSPDAGMIRLGPSVKAAYLPQVIHFPIRDVPDGPVPQKYRIQHQLVGGPFGPCQDGERSRRPV